MFTLKGYKHKIITRIQIIIQIQTNRNNLSYPSVYVKFTVMSG